MGNNGTAETYLNKLQAFGNPSLGISCYNVNLISLTRSIAKILTM